MSENINHDDGIINLTLKIPCYGDCDDCPVQKYLDKCPINNWDNEDEENEGEDEDENKYNDDDCFFDDIDELPEELLNMDFEED